MGLDGLDRDEQLGGALLVGVAAGDESHDLPLARREAVELGVGHRHLARSGTEGVQDESGQARGEGGVSGGHAPHGLGQVLGGDRLGDVAAGAGPDDADDVVAGVRDAQGQEARLGDVVAGGDDLGPSPAVAAGQVDVEQDDVGPQGVDGGDGALDVVGLGDDVQVGGVGGQLGAHPGADQGVVVDDQDPQGRARIGGLVVVCGGTGGRVSHEGLPGGDVG